MFPLRDIFEEVLQSQYFLVSVVERLSALRVHTLGLVLKVSMDV